MQQRHFLMTILTSTAIRSCQPRNHFLLKNASRRNNFSAIASLHCDVPSKIGTYPASRPRVSAFQNHRCFSSANAATTVISTPSTTLSLASPTQSDLVTRWTEQGQISPEEDYTICFASASRKKTSNLGSGMVLYDSDGTELWWGHQSLGDVTKNEGDYLTLVQGLQCARSLGVQHITAQICNQLVQKQMEGTNKVKAPSLKESYKKAMLLVGEFDSFRIRHVEKSLNKRAVEIAKKALDSMQITSEVKSDTDSDATIPPPENNENEIEHVSPSSSSDRDASPDAASLSPEKTYVLRFDGGSRGNPGTAGAGMVLYDSEDGSELWSACQYLGDKNTNNEAEYMGLITGLECARSLGVENIVVQGDSQLILRQIEGRYQVKSPSLKPFYKKAMTLSREFASFQTSHIERARNARADELANEAMDTKSSKGFHFS